MMNPKKHIPLFRRRNLLKMPAGWGRMHPMLAQLYASRGAQPHEAHPKIADLVPASQLKGIEVAADRIADAVQAGELIVCAGDYDCDGASAASVCVLALRMMGAKDPRFLVPDRITMGYGLSPKLVDMATDLKATLIITVDNGISAHAGVDHANRKGASVVVTDHHLAPETLPSAAAIVNPNQPDCPFPSKNMAGVGVIFSTMLATRKVLRDRGWFESRPEANLSSLLDLVAIGTIADVVKLDYNNRVLVEAGLAQMRKGPLRPGLQALFEVAKIEPLFLVSSDIAFKAAPRINSAGRLEHMSAGIELLCCDDLFRARDIAAQLNDLNTSRKELQAQMQEQATDLMVDIPKDVVGLALHSEHWHEGVVGLVAGRIKEQEYRPTIAFAKAHEAGLLKGSARSIPGIHIRDILANISAKHPGLIPKMGGHAMAAGLSCPEHRLAEFQRAFDAECRAAADEDMLKHVVETDGPLSTADLNLETAQLIQSGGPWGQGFSQPLFEGRFLVKKASLMGKESEHVRYTLTDGVNEVNAVHFFAAEGAQMKGYLDLVYQPSINRWRGEESLQLLIEHAG